MTSQLTRRQALAGALGAALPAPAKSPVIDTHIHLFAADQKRFPYHPNATYRPPAAPLEPYLEFVRAAGIDHSVIVHPEPYQDDHSYLTYCFDNEKPKGLFKGTILLDPIDPKTPPRMGELVKQYGGRIVAMRIHAMNPPGEPPLQSGPIKNRDLRDPRMKAAWAKAADLGIAIQMHFLPHHAPAIGALCGQFPGLPVILDHMGRIGMGGADALDAVMALARHPRTHFKFSGVGYSSKQPHPHRDAKPIVERAFREFGADRVLWGGLGHNLEEYQRAQTLLASMFDFAPEADRAKVRGINAARLYGFAP